MLIGNSVDAISNLFLIYLELEERMNEWMNTYVDSVNIRQIMKTPSLYCYLQHVFNVVQG